MLVRPYNLRKFVRQKIKAQGTGLKWAPGTKIMFHYMPNFIFVKIKKMHRPISNLLGHQYKAKQGELFPPTYLTVGVKKNR